jgi:hypothetical protein
MKESKDKPKAAGSCFDGTPCAEMMEKIMGQEGIGSLCQEMMRSFVKRSRTEKDNGPGSPAAKNKDEDPRTGGRK